MHTKNEPQTTSYAWLNTVKQSLQSKTTGSFSGHDTTGSPITLTYEVIDPTTPQLSEKLKSLAPILTDTYAEAELAFARAHPERVPTEWFLQPIAPLFTQGVEKVDWQRAEQDLKAFLQNFFTTTDFSVFSKAGDIVIGVVATDHKTGDTLGLIQFIITPEYEYGSIKAGFFGVTNTAQKRGIEELLMCTIFNILPQVERIFLHARVTNTHFLNTCYRWGFKKFVGPLEHWTDVEYKAKEESTLQKRAATLL